MTHVHCRPLPFVLAVASGAVALRAMPCRAQQRLPRKPGVQLERFVWRVLNKMSVPVRNRASEWLWNHSFLPGEHDYHFSAEAAATAPVLVAVCHGANTKN